MSILKRSLLFIYRKRGKSILLLLLTTAVFLLVLTGLSLSQAFDTAALNMRQSLGGTFIMQPDLSNPDNLSEPDIRKKEGEDGSTSSLELYAYNGDVLDQEVINKVMETPGIDSYSARIQYFPDLLAADGSGIKLIEGNEIFQNNPDWINTVKIEGQAGLQGNSMDISYFQNGTLELMEGDLDDSVPNGLLISKELANLNSLSVGDELILAIRPKSYAPERPEMSLTCKVSGIFQVTRPQENALQWASAYRLENRVFIDPVVISDFFARAFPDDISGYDRVYFRVNDPAELENIVAALQANEDINWSCFGLDLNDEDYQKAAAPIQDMERLVQTLTAIIVAAGVLILGLILTMWAKSRVREVGLFLSIGVGKGNILLQRLAEMALITVAALLLAVSLSFTVAQGVGNAVLGQANDQIETRWETEEASTDEMGMDQDAFEPVFGAPKLTELKVQITPQVMGTVSLGFLPLIFAVVCLSNLSVFLLKPKQILMRLSD